VAHIPDAELRRNDYSLSDDQQFLRDTFVDFFTRECPSSRVREAEPRGFDEKLWRSLLHLDTLTMGLPEERGGGGASLVDLALVTEQSGRYLAPVPLVDAVVAMRLLDASAPDRVAGWVDRTTEGNGCLTLALRPVGRATARQLVPAGAVATGVLAFDGDDLVLATSEDPPPLVGNQGRAPLAWWDLSESSGRSVLASGQRAHALYDNAVRDWKLLTAAALVGLGDGAIELGLDFVKNRQAFETPIGAFQAVSHALADAHTGVVGARHLTWKAAWFAGTEPQARPELASMAFLYAAQAATKAVTVGTHVQGGFGFTVESDLQLYFRRAKGWSVLAGDPRAELSTIGELLAQGR
jgi:alkylation response protein AidB-like acyl-CoA dehydrogenase